MKEVINELLAFIIVVVWCSIFYALLYENYAPKKQMPIVESIVKDKDLYLYLYKNEKGTPTYIVYEDSNLYQIGDTLFK